MAVAADVCGMLPPNQRSHQLRQAVLATAIRAEG